MSPETAGAVTRGDTPKGDVVSVARIAGIQAAKRTPELIPLCHPLALSFLDVVIEVDAQVAALTVYDMVKGLERGVEVGPVVLLEKTGGKEDWRR